MSTQFCMYCEQQLPPGIKFCPNCGKAVMDPADLILQSQGKTIKKSSSPPKVKPTVSIKKEHHNQVKQPDLTPADKPPIKMNVPPKPKPMKLDHIKTQIPKISTDSVNLRAIWQWFTHSLAHPFAHPFAMSYAPKWAGISSSIIYYVLLIWAMTSNLNQFMLKHTGIDYVNNQTSKLGLSDTINKLEANSSFQNIIHAFTHAWWALIYLSLPIVIGLLYVGIHLLRENTKWDFDILDQFMHRFNIAIPTTILAILCKYIDQPNIGLGFIFITMVMGIIAIISTMKIYQYEYRIPFPAVLTIWLFVISVSILFLFVTGLDNAESAIKSTETALSDNTSNVASSITNALGGS